MAATVKPWSSLTKTRGSAHHTAALVCPRASADSEKASSGTANAISWKSNWGSCCKPQENPYATAIARPGPTPSFSRASWLTGKTDAAASSACATTSVAEEGKTRKKGARTATIGWK